MLKSSQKFTTENHVGIFLNAIIIFPYKIFRQMVKTFQHFVMAFTLENF